MSPVSGEHSVSWLAKTLIESNYVKWSTLSNRRFWSVKRDNPVTIIFDSDTYIYWVQMTNQVPSLSIPAVELRRVP